MDVEDYTQEYDLCSSRLEVLNHKRIGNLTMVPPVCDKNIISELVGLTYKQGLLQCAIKNPFDGWGEYDYLLYLYDHPELREREEEPEYDQMSAPY